MPEGFYTIPEAASKMGLSQDELLRTVSTAGIKKFQDQGQLVFKAEDIDRLASSVKRPSPGDSIFQSSSSGLFDVDDLMAELGGGGAKQMAPSGGGGMPSSSDKSALMDEPTATAPVQPARPAPAAGAVMSDSGLFNVQELVNESEIINQKPIIPDDSTVIESPARRTTGPAPAAGGGVPAGAVMSDSGLFDVQGMVGQQPASGINAPVAPPSPGAVMSDSGLFGSQGNVEQVASGSGSGFQDVVASAGGPNPGSAVLTPIAASDSSLGMSLGAEMSGSGSVVTNVPGSATQPPASGAAVPEGRPGSGAVMSDSGLFDVRDLVAAPGSAVQPPIDQPTRVIPGSPGSGMGSGFSRPARFQAKGSGQSDSGLFSAAEVAKAVADANKGQVEEPTRRNDPIPGGGITIFDPSDFSSGTADANSQTMDLAAQPDRRDPKHGSGAGLRSPRAAREGTSLGGEIIGGLEEPNMQSPPPRGLSSSAIFGAQRGPVSSPNAQTEILDAQQPFRTTTSGIFGTQAGRKASPNMQTEIMDAQPFEEQVAPATARSPSASPSSSVVGSDSAMAPAESGDLFSAEDLQNAQAAQQGAGSVSTYPESPSRTARAMGQQQSFSTMPTAPMQAIEPADPAEPPFGFFLIVSLVLLVLGTVMGGGALAGLKMQFVQGFSQAGMPLLIGGGVVLVGGLVAGFILGNKK